jgi:hypothetical protein
MFVSARGTLIQTARLRLLLGHTREQSKPRRFVSKERPIFWGMTLVGGRLLIDLCKPAVLIGSQEHGMASSLANRAEHNETTHGGDQGQGRNHPQLAVGAENV